MRLPSADARLAPICSDGSSGPSECPDPMAKRCRDELPDGSPKRNVAVVDIQRRLGLVYTAASSQRKYMNNEHRDNQASETRRQQSPRMATA